MEINDFVYVTFEKDFEVRSTHVVLKEKLDVFVNDKYAMFGVGIAHINKATMYLNGSEWCNFHYVYKSDFDVNDGEKL